MTSMLGRLTVSSAMISSRLRSILANVEGWEERKVEGIERRDRNERSAQIPLDNGGIEQDGERGPRFTAGSSSCAR